MVRAIRDNSDFASGDNKVVFTPDSATEMLPLVRRIVADLMRLSRSIDEQQEQIRGIDQLQNPIDHSDYQDEIFDIRGSLQRDQISLDRCLDELAALGVESHRPIDGHVDFPAVIQQRSVRLCWHPGDERVQHWHEIGQSADQRASIEL